MDIALAIVSIAAFVMSATTCVLTFINNRKKLNIYIYEYQRADKAHNFRFGFENESRVPITINRMFLFVENQKFENKPVSSLVQKMVYHDGGVNNLFSMDFPIAIPALGAQKGIVVFGKCPIEIPECATQLTFQVNTNRGMINKMILDIPPDAHRRMMSQ